MSVNNYPQEYTLSGSRLNDTSTADDYPECKTDGNRITKRKTNEKLQNLILIILNVKNFKMYLQFFKRIKNSAK